MRNLELVVPWSMEPMKVSRSFLSSRNERFGASLCGCGTCDAGSIPSACSSMSKVDYNKEATNEWRNSGTGRQRIRRSPDKENYRLLNGPINRVGW